MLVWKLFSNFFGSRSRLFFDRITGSVGIDRIRDRGGGIYRAFWRYLDVAGGVQMVGAV